jgi:glucosamine--fructose-6-phosphate aminotransferase (isomerizing)
LNAIDHNQPPGALAEAAFGDCRRAMEETLAEMREPLQALARKLRERGIHRIVFTGEGCSYTAEMASAPALKRTLPVPAEVIVASDLPLFPGIVDRDTCVVAVSRTGERRFVLEVLEAAKAAGAMLVAITGNPDGKLTQVADVTLPTLEGPEPAYLKSKSTFAALIGLLGFAVALSEDAPGNLTWEMLETVPELVERGFALARGEKAWLADAVSREHWAVLGSGAGFGAASDAALKLQETSLVHASAHALGFFYHGPLGAVTQQWGSLVLASADSQSWTEIIARELVHAEARPVVVLTPETLELDVRDVHRIVLPDPTEATAGNRELAELLVPFVQLPAVYACLREISLGRGLNPDVPPNMEYMLELILPAGTREPDLRQRAS